MEIKGNDTSTQPTLCSSALDSEPSLRWPVSQGGCGLSDRRFRPLRFRACLFSRQPTVRAWSPPSPKPPRAACSELSSSADTRSWTSSSIVRRKCLEGKETLVSQFYDKMPGQKHQQCLGTLFIVLSYSNVGCSREGFFKFNKQTIETKKQFNTWTS